MLKLCLYFRRVLFLSRGRNSTPPPAAMTIFFPRPSTAAHTGTTSPISCFIAVTGRPDSTGKLCSSISGAAGSGRWNSAAKPTVNARSAGCVGMTTSQRWVRMRSPAPSYSLSGEQGRSSSSWKVAIPPIRLSLKNITSLSFSANFQNSPK